MAKSWVEPPIPLKGISSGPSRRHRQSFRCGLMPGRSNVGVDQWEICIGRCASCRTSKLGMLATEDAAQYYGCAIQLKVKRNAVRWMSCTITMRPLVRRKVQLAPPGR